VLLDVLCIGKYAIHTCLWSMEHEQSVYLRFQERWMLDRELRLPPDIFQSFNGVVCQSFIVLVTIASFLGLTSRDRSYDNCTTALHRNQWHCVRDGHARSQSEVAVAVAISTGLTYSARRCCPTQGKPHALAHVMNTQRHAATCCAEMPSGGSACGLL
jgi:hypothetical protein